MYLEVDVMSLLRGEPFTLLHCCNVSFLIVLPPRELSGPCSFWGQIKCKKRKPLRKIELCKIENHALYWTLYRILVNWGLLLQFHIFMEYDQWSFAMMEQHHGQWPSRNQVKESHSIQSYENNLQRYIFKSLWQGLSIILLSLVRTPRAYQTQKDNPNKSLKRTPLIPSEDTLILGNDS